MCRLGHHVCTRRYCRWQYKHNSKSFKPRQLTATWAQIIIIFDYLAGWCCFIYKFKLHPEMTMTLIKWASGRSCTRQALGNSNKNRTKKVKWLSTTVLLSWAWTRFIQSRSRMTRRSFWLILVRHIKYKRIQWFSDYLYKSLFFQSSPDRSQFATSAGESTTTFHCRLLVQVGLALFQGFSPGNDTLFIKLS